MATSKRIKKRTKTEERKPTLRLLKNSILFETKNQLNKDDKYKLFDYYVLRPINLRDVSRKSINFKLSTLTNEDKRRLMSIFDYLNDEHFNISRDTQTIESWFSNGMCPSELEIEKERICILDSYVSNSRIPSLYYFVRNCLCHANFEVISVKNNSCLILEDNDKSYIRGRGIIKVKTLINFAECLLEIMKSKSIYNLL